MKTLARGIPERRCWPWWPWPSSCAASIPASSGASPTAFSRPGPTAPWSSRRRRGRGSQPDRPGLQRARRISIPGPRRRGTAMTPPVSGGSNLGPLSRSSSEIVGRRVARLPGGERPARRGARPRRRRDRLGQRPGPAHQPGECPAPGAPRGPGPGALRETAVQELIEDRGRGPGPGLPGRAPGERAAAESGAWTRRRSMTEDRADAFLRMIRRSRRGRLKVYLGYGAGVGKTYQMLQEGHRLEERGIDVVVGLVETHGRADTAELAEGLEVVPRRRAGYRGIALEEMDVDAVLARKPAGRPRGRAGPHQCPGQPERQALRGRAGPPGGRDPCHHAP